MRILLLAFGMMLTSGVAQAQYENLVEQKLGNLSALEIKVESSADLSIAGKAWALQKIEESKMMLIEASALGLEDLQKAEQAINQTAQKVAQRLLGAQKAKLHGRIAMLDAMIEQYQLEGLDTTELEILSDLMKVQVKGLMH